MRLVVDDDRDGRRREEEEGRRKEKDEKQSLWWDERTKEREEREEKVEEKRFWSAHLVQQSFIQSSLVALALALTCSQRHPHSHPSQTQPARNGQALITALDLFQSRYERFNERWKKNRDPDPRYRTEI